MEKDQNIAIKMLRKDGSVDAQSFYRKYDYEWRPNDRDLVFVAKAHDNIIGIVRLCLEYQVQVLRGMFVDAQYQRQGIGKRLLQLLEKEIDRDVYCLPYDHLQDFYGTIGFKTISPEEAPAFLQDRLRIYAERYDALIIMKRLLVN